ncbi:hypothetical protein EYF80_024696 [Liparis tanakae]|uniref:Uncharacterized protein n=1 Tax=Liparis tanakae TaxID=230148 RepID=A0A4Z2HGV3_9TELE|nr:hypothetical protein EYF80_024696 [Liparis tanakae]
MCSRREAALLSVVASIGRQVSKTPSHEYKDWNPKRQSPPAGSSRQSRVLTDSVSPERGSYCSAGIRPSGALPRRRRRKINKVMNK